jgi:glycosyltransferase involved in cell wall biosynthesis
MKDFKCSLIISTFNWPEALELCLLSILNQAVLPHEVIIADDGSTDATRDLIDRYKGSFPVPLLHVWHPDDGFRLAQIRNKAIAAASGEYIVQIDGDLILHRHFISDHIRFAERKTFVRASRVYLNEFFSASLLRSKCIVFSPFSVGVSNKMSALRLPFLWSFFEHNYKSKGDERWEIHGCNMAYWRDDAVLVNGYNEDFKGWGPEDKEFIVRLLNSGIHKRFIKMGALVFHLYHSENTKSNLPVNEALLKSAIREEKRICVNGLNQYL